ncbi:hypothetical protein HT746_00240 [Burkholderia pyrrocinia]|uniref:hypothetical protein n=1 Tax=Burkholderia pyrrocinia TaxID=60550 RepID=UPI0015762C94|nr:hypothetical protein [Burkholderia pyrrocinia]NTX25598.1 hypothetical protein [Burkholderia pyrrocinia]
MIFNCPYSRDFVGIEKLQKAWMFDEELFADVAEHQAKWRRGAGVLRGQCRAVSLVRRTIPGHTTSDRMHLKRFHLSIRISGPCVFALNKIVRGLQSGEFPDRSDDV